MKFLVDESLSGTVAKLLPAAGLDAVHVSDRKLLGATDMTVMDTARDEGRVVASADTDFGELLALDHHPGPSVIIFRRAPHRPPEQAALLNAAMPDLAASLEAGAVVVLTRATARIPPLPI